MHQPTRPDHDAELDDRLAGTVMASGLAAYRWAAAALLATVLLTIARALMLAAYSYSRLGGVVTVFAVIVAVVDGVCAIMLWRGSAAGRAITLFRALAGMTVGMALIVFADGSVLDRATAVFMQLALCITLFLLLLRTPGRWMTILAMALLVFGYGLPVTLKTAYDCSDTWRVNPISAWIDRGGDAESLWEPAATPEPGSTYTRDGIAYGRFEHCDADGCIALDMPAGDTHETDIGLVSRGGGRSGWNMTATLYALDADEVADRKLIPNAFEFCIDYWVEWEHFDRYRIIDSDVRTRTGFYELATTGDGGEGIAYVYLEASDTQLIELCMEGSARADEMRPVFERAMRSVAITGDPEASIDALATPMPGSTYTRDGIAYGRFEHCDADGCLAADLAVIGAEDGETSLWSLGDYANGEGSAWMMAVTCYAIDPTEVDDPALIPDALDTCVDWWIDGGAFDTYELVDSDVTDRTGLYQIAIDGEDGEGIAWVYLELVGEQLLEVATFGPESAELYATFYRAVDTVEVTGPPEPTEDVHATPQPGSETRHGAITFGRYEHCDADGCFAIALPADLAAEDEDSLYCGQEDWVLSAVIIADEGTPGAPDPSLATVVEWAIEGWYDSGGIASVFDEHTEQGDDWISYSAGCTDAQSVDGACYVWAELQEGRIKIIWAVDYDPTVDVATIMEHARDTFVITD